MKQRIGVLVVILTVAALTAQTRSAGKAGYILGPEDQLTVRVQELEEYAPAALGVIRIDTLGDIRLPIVGRIHAEGLAVGQLEAEIARGLKSTMQEPEVTVAVVSFRSHPVSVLGAVKTPGVHQITGRKSLFEVLSLAGGLNPDAGNVIKITRSVQSGALPLPNAVRDPSGEFFIGELNVRAVMDAKSPRDNITVLADDVITVPKADLVYVIGAVKRSGGFVLSEKEKISALQALSLAEGLDRGAAPNRAKILRAVEGNDNRTEIAVDLKLIMSGKAADVALRANDILFVPTSVPKNAAFRTMEAAIQMGTGVVIYRR